MNTRYYRKKKKKKIKRETNALINYSTIFSQLVFCKPVDK